MKMIAVYIGYFLVAYILHSFAEWGIHTWMDKYEFLHQKHHKTTQDAGGMYFSLWNIKVLLPFLLPTILLMSLQLIIFPRSNWIILFSIHLLIALYTITIWNTLHGYMHGHDCSKQPFHITSGLCLSNDKAKTLLKVFPFLNFIIKNHMHHHKTNSSNYTITLPFADFVMGTYRRPTP